MLGVNAINLLVGGDIVQHVPESFTTVDVYLAAGVHVHHVKLHVREIDTQF